MDRILFSPAERRGIMVFLLLIFLVHLSVDAYLSHLQAERGPSEKERNAFIAIIKEHQSQDSLFAIPRDYNGTINPNSASEEKLVASGLSQKITSRLLNFREKGVKFYGKQDLHRVYGMDTSWLNAPGITFQYARRLKTENDRDNNSWKQGDLRLSIFDPNTVSEETLLEMHLPKGAARGILSFRDRYREFERNDDIYAVYSIDSALANQIRPFLNIKMKDIIKSSLDTINWPINVNVADTNQLKQVKGIGSYLAKSIVDYRESLGGFYSLNQLLDLYSVDSSRLEKFVNHLYCDSLYAKLNINKTSEEELYGHPYVSYKLARNIVEFRERMRLFENAEELMNIELVDGVLFSKLVPYLEVR
jgi:DNA uptake protein ComE-like DNA-binding protein